MAVSSLRLLPLSPWLASHISTARFSNSKRPLNLLVRFSTSPSAALVSSDGVAETATAPKKWEAFRKKKVVMRVGYVGSDYRGLQMQRDEHALSTKSIDENEVVKQILNYHPNITRKV